MIKKKMTNKGTKTSSFGVSKRENHDSSIFYSRKLYQATKKKQISLYKEVEITDHMLDGVHCIDSRDLSILPDESIHLMVTSPPYNCGKSYDENLDLHEHRTLMFEVFEQVYEKLVVGGRAIINIANLGRNPYIPMHSYLIHDMLEIGYLMRGEIIWQKAVSAAGSTAWGSWMSASNPTLRDIHEYILVFSKESMRREKKGKMSTISREEFMEFTTSIWNFSPESAKRVGHPAPFPEELPRRFIELYTFENDVVLDPFCGSGTTCLAALKANRRYVGFDNSEEYVKLARERIQDFLDE